MLRNSSDRTSSYIPMFENLEPKLLLSAQIYDVSSVHDDFRFLAGDDLPAVNNTYTASLTDAASVTRVDFSIGSTTIADTTAADGWFADFNMSSLTSADDLQVRVYEGGSLVDSTVHDIDMLVLPNWLEDSSVTYSATHSWSAGYQLDIDQLHYDQSIYTPSDWVFEDPLFGITLLDMANLRTGFSASSHYEIDSLADGTVISQGYSFNLEAEILGESIMDETMSIASSNSISYNRTFGDVEITGSLSYGGSLNPSFNNQLMFDGISGYVWVDPTLDISIPLGSLSVPVGGGVASVTGSAAADISFGTNSTHMLSLSPTVTGAGFTMDNFEFHPNLDIGLSVTGGVGLLGGYLASGHVILTGTVSQALDASYTSTSGWHDVAAPGSLTLSGSAGYDVLKGWLFEGEADLFEWEVGIWNFLDSSGSNVDFDNDHWEDDSPLDHINDINGSADSSSLSAGDFEWYSFYLTGDAPAGSEIYLNHDGGSDVTFALYDRDLNGVDYPTTRVDSTTVSMDVSGLGKELYFVKVYSPTMEAVDSFGLTWSIPGAGGVSVMEVVDCSGSMSGSKMDGAKNAASLFVNLLGIGDKIGVVKYTSSASVAYALTEIGAYSTVQQDAVNVISSFSAGGGTSILAGLQAADSELDRFPTDSGRAMILMSDGLAGSPLDFINSSVDPDIRIYTIAFGSNADLGLLQQIASARNGQCFVAADNSDLQAIYTSLLGLAGGMEQVVNFEGAIAQGDQQTRAIRIDESSLTATFGINWPGSDLDLMLETPGGVIIYRNTVGNYPDIQYVEGSTYEYYKVNAPDAGQWKVHVVGVSTSQAEEPYNLYTMLDSPITVSAQAEKAGYQTGELINLQVTLDDGSPLTGADVTAIVHLPDGASTDTESMILYDDGNHNDLLAGDGVYGGAFTLARWAGDYVFQIEATGTTLTGIDYYRSPSVTIQVAPGADDDGDGLPNIWEDREGTQRYVIDDASDPDNDLLTNLQEYTYGTKAMTADTDADGLIDGLEISSGRDPLVPDAPVEPRVSFYRQDISVGLSPRDITTGDFNSDGYIDIAVTNYVDSSVTVLYGESSGGYKTSETLAAGFGAMGITSDDFNNDGVLDLAVINNFDRTLSLIYGKVAGGFESQQVTSTTSIPQDIVSGDFNGDGRIDLAISTSAGKVDLLAGLAGGGFATPVRTYAGQLPLAMTVGDFNGDGIDDIATANDQDDTISILHGSTAGFLLADTVNVGDGPTDVLAADFNEDGLVDLAVSNNDDDDVTLLFGQSDGSFGSRLDLATAQHPRALAYGDFDGDGYMDIAACASSNLVSILHGSGGGAFGDLRNVAAQSLPDALAVADFNGDGLTDLAAVNKLSHNISLLYSWGQAVSQNAPVGNHPRDLITADLNNDGFADLVTTNFEDRTISVLYGHSSGYFSHREDITVGQRPWAVTAGDFDGDGLLDLAVSNYDSDDVSILLGQSGGGFASAVNVSVGDQPRGITSGDFNGDGLDDLAVSNYGDNTITVVFSQGAGSFGGRQDMAVGNSPWTPISGDLNNDGIDDIAVSNELDASVSILYSLGDGSFAYGQLLEAGNVPRGLAAGDFNEDGLLDLAIANHEDDNVMIIYGLLGGGFGGGQSVAVGDGPMGISLRYAEDGRAVLAISNWYDDSASVIYAQADGSFAARRDVAVGNSPWGLVWGSFCGEDTEDLAVSNWHEDYLSIIRDVYFSPSYVTGSYVFLNNSQYDSSGNDEDAIYYIETPLIPGESASALNMNQFSGGVNGLIIDIDNIPDPQNLTLATVSEYFNFEICDFYRSYSWSSAASPVSVTVNVDGGPNGSDRVILTWADGAVKNQWLRVTVLAGQATGLFDNEVFAFGNLAGDANMDFIVNLDDFIALKQNYGVSTNASMMQGDFNCDGTVNLDDFIVLKQNYGTIIKWVNYPEYERASVSNDGEQADGRSRRPSVSSDGRYVAYKSEATNLVEGDTNGVEDVFVTDTQTNVTWRISVNNNGEQGNGASDWPSISPDGRYVVFSSEADNLVAGDTNGCEDVFLYDLQTNTIVAVTSGGDGDSYSPVVSEDARAIAFCSNATNLVSGDLNGRSDIFVYDPLTGKTELASVSASGEAGNYASEVPAISANGRYIAYQSNATNLVAGDTNSSWDVFVYDRNLDTVEIVSVSSTGSIGNADSRWPVLSGDGRYVTYMSDASNLVYGDTNAVYDAFIYDRLMRQTKRINAGPGVQPNDLSYRPSISLDGRYVTFMSQASNLVGDDINHHWDIFVYDQQTQEVSRVTVLPGYDPDDDSLYPVISGDGNVIVFESQASNLVDGDTNASFDIFVASFR